MITVLMMTLAFAQEAAEPEAPPVDLDSATEVEGITSEQYQFLKPKRYLLEQNPYADTDYTAYALEWGEVKLGLAGVHLGVLPRIQIGSQPILDAIGIYNVNGKANALRVGPVDVAVLGQFTTVPLGGFNATWVGGGGMVSVRAADSFTVHTGAVYGALRASGIPSRPPALLRALVNQDDIDAMAAQAAELGVEPAVRGDALFLRLAMDYRLNRRDSVIFQAQTIGTGHLTTSLGSADEYVALLFPQLSEDALSSEQRFVPSQAYTLTLSWQFSWQQIALRMGGGWSADKFTWILQGNDLSYRFWGQTRQDDGRRKRGWRKSRQEIEE